MNRTTSVPVTKRLMKYKAVMVMTLEIPVEIEAESWGEFKETAKREAMGGGGCRDAEVVDVTFNQVEVEEV